MHAHPTLSSELVDLYEHVNRQADEYVELFNVLRRKTRELDELRHEMQRQLTEFKATSAEDQRTARQAVELTLEELGQRVSFVHEVHKDLDDLRRLKTALIDLRSSFQKKSMELDTVVNSVQQFIKSEVESTFINQDKNIDRKLKAVITELTTFDTRLVNIQDLHRREFQQMSEDLAKLKGRIADTKYLVDDATKSIEELLEAQNEKIGDKTRQIEEELNGSIKQLVDSLVNEGVFKERVDALRVDLHAISRRLRDQDSGAGVKAMIGIGLGGLALLIALATLVLK